MLKEDLKGAEFSGLLSPLGTAGVAGGQSRACSPYTLAGEMPGTQTLPTALWEEASVGRCFALPLLMLIFIGKKIILKWLGSFLPSEKIMEFVTVNLGYVQ